MRFKRPQKYFTGVKYWAAPNPNQNFKDEYLSLNVKMPYINSIIDCLRSSYDSTSQFTLHELGCGWGTNLEFIKKEFPNSILTANDVWVDAIQYVKSNRPYVDIVEKDTFDFIEQSVENNRCFDVIITNAHLIHITDEKLLGLKNLFKICNHAILQENIENLETAVDNMTLKEAKRTYLPDADYRYFFTRKDS